ncbi:MAG: hypothetical protein P8L18_12055 [Verrucomicrobiota bacterium]|nr:hypothetical protein [Verrucomicrobiota bacterium]
MTNPDMCGQIDHPSNHGSTWFGNGKYELARSHPALTGLSALLTGSENLASMNDVLTRLKIS